MYLKIVHSGTLQFRMGDLPNTIKDECQSYMGSTKQSQQSRKDTQVRMNVQEKHNTVLVEIKISQFDHVINLSIYYDFNLQ
jgi:hypothetical protein